MSVDAATVRAVTHEVCVTTLDMPVHDRDEPVTPAGIDQMAAEVIVDGDWNAKISVIASKQLARCVAGRMFDQEASDVAECDIEDSLCELVNIIGGNLKGIVGQEARLAIPSLVPAGLVQAGGTSVATSYEFDQEELSVVVESC